MVEPRLGLIWMGRDPEHRRALSLSSIKFTPRGGSIEVGCRIDGLGVCVPVRDTRVGIEAQDRSAVYDRFFR